MSVAGGTLGFLDARSSFIKIFRVPEGGSLSAFVRDRAVDLQADIVRHGGVLIRGGTLRSPHELNELVRVVCPGDPFLYQGGSAYRTNLGPGVYSAAESHPDVEIVQHHEAAYFRRWPTHLALFCEVPPIERGSTPLCDNRALTRRLPTDILDLLSNASIRYERNLHRDLHADYIRSSFGSPDSILEVCAAQGMTAEWRGEFLHLQYDAPAVTRHPATGELLHFSQIYAHNWYAYDGYESPAFRRGAAALFDPERARGWGRRTPLQIARIAGDSEPRDQLLELFDSEYAGLTRTFRWESGDLALIDNILTTHGRQPYRGPRKLWLAFGPEGHHDR